MESALINNTKQLEKLSGIVSRITFHNQDNGWSVLRVGPFNRVQDQVTVVIHQSKVFAGATMDFFGNWISHPKYGQQFKALRAVERRPATTAALEKYLGSGLIFGVGPKTAKKIVAHFKSNTLEVFEKEIDRLTEVEGIARKKLESITNSWIEHREIRNVMLFLQSHNISTLFAVKIYKTYGDKAIEVVQKNPYTLAKDIYGIGFLSADQIANHLGIEKNSQIRIIAGIKHVLNASRDEGHCYLTRDQILNNVSTLLELDLNESIDKHLKICLEENELRFRELDNEKLYYAKSCFYDENYCVKKIKDLNSGKTPVDLERVERWIDNFCATKNISLSSEQKKSVMEIVQNKFSILTGGPGCGKTTTTNVLVKLLRAMNKKVILAAPTGRAAQRMSEVIGMEAKTIHRLLSWQPAKGRFKKCEEDPLDVDCLIIDECSMLDINLTAGLLRAVPLSASVLFIGDSDQLPSVGAGNVLGDLIDSQAIPCFKLTEVFRQARQSKIIEYAHKINRGDIPYIDTPIKYPDLWEEKRDCLFIDAEEATKEQLVFLSRVNRVIKQTRESGDEQIIEKDDLEQQYLKKSNSGELYLDAATPNKNIPPALKIPAKFKHVNLENFINNPNSSNVDELKEIIKKIHPYSSLHYNMTSLDVIKRLYQETIPKHFGANSEIQILSPMTRGSLGTHNLNRVIQNTINPFQENSPQITLGDRIYRIGDRVIQKRNNYDLHVFNGDIGKIIAVDSTDLSCVVRYGQSKEIAYKRDTMVELELAYAITIHKSQGSEFGVVIIPVTTQHFKMLFRNLIYTGLTRARKLAIFVGTRRALAMSVKNIDTRKRQTALKALLQ